MGGGGPGGMGGIGGESKPRTWGEAGCGLANEPANESAKRGVGGFLKGSEGPQAGQPRRIHTG